MCCATPSAACSPWWVPAASVRLAFFYLYTLQRQWPVLELVKPPCQTRLPVALNREEVRQVLGYLPQPHYRVCLSTIYTCGLRLQEGVCLQMRDIDSQRMVIHVRQGKRSRDRYAPLPERTPAHNCTDIGDSIVIRSGSFPVAMRVLTLNPRTKVVSSELFGPHSSRVVSRKRLLFTPYATAMPPIC